MFVNGYRFSSFIRNIRKIIKWKIYQTLLRQAKKTATDAIKTISKRLIQITEEATNYLIGIKIANEITKKPSPNNPGTSSETEEKLSKIPKESCIFPEKKTSNYWCAKINIIIYQYKHGI